MNLTGKILILGIIISLFACSEGKQNYEQTGFYTILKNAPQEGKDTAVIKRFVAGKLQEEMIFGNMSEDSKELIRYNEKGDMTFSKLIVPSAGYLSQTEIAYAPGAYVNGLKTSMQVAGQQMEMAYRYEDSKTSEKEITQKVYDITTDTLVGTTLVTLNEQGLVSMRVESWKDEPGAVETYKYNENGQKTEVKTMPQHDHSDHHGHDHGDESATTTFSYQNGHLVKEISAVEGQSLTTEYFYADNRLSKIVMTDVIGGTKKVTEIGF